MSEQTDIKREITVLGAGVVGLCCAVSLQREGHAVTLIDRDEPGAGTSSGNAGLIQIDSVIPIATPGILREVPRMLMDPKGPLVLRWRYAHRIAPWLFLFLRESRPKNVERISRDLASLLDLSNASWLALIDAAGARDMWRESGELHAYRTRGAWEAARPSHALRRQRGSALQELTVEEMRQLEPALSRDLHAGVFTPDANSIAHPLHLSQRLADLFRRDGGKIVRDEITGVESEPSGEPSVLAGRAGRYPVRTLIIAAGAFSKPFAAATGSRLPLETERGYHLWLPDPGVEMRRPIVVGDHRFGIVPMTGGIRLVGTVEFAGLEIPPYWERADVLAELARPFVPGLRFDGAERWMGYRPSMPDSLPVIGRAPGRRDVYFAFGHGHLGLTMAAVTGRIVADLVAGRKPPLDLTPFRPERF